MDHYGGWGAALRKALARRSNAQTNAHASAMSRHDDGVLFVVPDPAHEEAWVRAGEYICELLARIPRRRSLVIEYAAAADGAFQLYARAGRAEAGVWCEIFPDELLSGELSDADEDHLDCEGWTPPNDASSSWRREGMPFEDAGHLILDGLRYGRNAPTLGCSGGALGNQSTGRDAITVSPSKMPWPAMSSHCGMPGEAAETLDAHCRA